jgi:hypothetical protein
MKQSHPGLTKSPAIPFDIIPNLSLRPRKAVGSELSVRVVLWKMGWLPEATPFVVMLPARPVANSLLECPRSEIHE